MGYRNIVPHMAGWSAGSSYPRWIVMSGGVVSGPAYCTDVDGLNLSTLAWSALADFPGTGNTYSASATLNQGVYVVGGYDGAETEEVDRYWLYGDVWSSRNDMSTAIQRAQIYSLSDASLFVTGGYDGATALQTNDQYTESTDAFAAKGLPKVSRYSGMYGSYGTYGFSGSGYNGTTYFQHTERYESGAADSWSDMQAAPTGYQLRAPGMSNSKLCGLGGENVGGSTADVDILNTQTNNWEATGVLSETRDNAAGSGHGGASYVFGGEDAGGNYSTDAIKWDIGVGSETSLTAINPGRELACGATIYQSLSDVGLIHRLGGTGGDSTKHHTYSIFGDTWASLTSSKGWSNNIAMVASTSVELVSNFNGVDNASWHYSLSSQTWATGTAWSGNITTGTRGGYDSTNDHVIHVGGRDSVLAVTVNTVNRYSVDAESWDTGTVLDHTVYWGHGFIVSGRKLVYVGGRTINGGTTENADTDEYDLLLESWDAKTPADSTLLRGGHWAANEDQCFVVGCQWGAVNNYQSLEYFDNSSDSWTGGTAHDVSKSDTGGSAMNGFYGFYAAGSSGSDSDSYERYTATWKALTNVLDAVSRLSLVQQ